MHSTWSYIADELDERGWSRTDLAIEMGGDVEFNLCALAFLEHVSGVHMQMGEFAERLAKAFGTSAELWVNIDESYRRELREAGAAGEG